jgi:hypothetical protein
MRRCDIVAFGGAPTTNGFGPEYASLDLGVAGRIAGNDRTRFCLRPSLP